MAKAMSQSGVGGGLGKKAATRKNSRQKSRIFWKAPETAYTYRQTFPTHKDRTDRVIIAQAITEKTPIISSDREFHINISNNE